MSPLGLFDPATFGGELEQRYGIPKRRLTGTISPRLALHQLLEPRGEGGFAAADRAEQVEHLLALFEALGGMAEEPDDPLDRVFHAEEIVREGGIDLDRPVHEDPAEARILGGVDHDRLADGFQQPLGRTRVKRRIVGTSPQIVLERVLHLAAVFVHARVKSEDALFIESHFSPQSTALSTATDERPFM